MQRLSQQSQLRQMSDASDPNWHTPANTLAKNLWCGTTLCAATTPAYGSFNLALHVQDDPSFVAANRRRLSAQIAQQVAQPLQGVAWIDQVHGTQVTMATTATLRSEPTADALWTDQPGVALAVLTADCLPVVLAAKQGGVVGIAHAGWRGLVGGVLQNLVAAMPVAPADLVAWGGPCIGPAAYVIGLDVTAAVAALPRSHLALSPGVTSAKRQLDLQQLARQLLLDCGVGHYQASPLCAFSERRCYSHRRDGGELSTGRMATVAVLAVDDPESGG